MVIKRFKLKSKYTLNHTLYFIILFSCHSINSFIFIVFLLQTIVSVAMWTFICAIKTTHHARFFHQIRMFLWLSAHVVNEVATFKLATFLFIPNTIFVFFLRGVSIKEQRDSKQRKQTL